MLGERGLVTPDADFYVKQTVLPVFVSVVHSLSAFGALPSAYPVAGVDDQSSIGFVGSFLDPPR